MSLEIHQRQMLFKSNCHTMCFPATSTKNEHRRNVLSLMAKNSATTDRISSQHRPQIDESVKCVSDSPLSNFFPSGSMSFTLKISSNSTPAILDRSDSAAPTRGMLMFTFDERNFKWRLWSLTSQCYDSTICNFIRSLKIYEMQRRVY